MPAIGAEATASRAAKAIINRISREEDCRRTLRPKGRHEASHASQHKNNQPINTDCAGIRNERLINLDASRIIGLYSQKKRLRTAHSKLRSSYVNVVTATKDNRTAEGSIEKNATKRTIRIERRLYV